jgi:hypothetical protein
MFVYIWSLLTSTADFNLYLLRDQNLPCGPGAGIISLQLITFLGGQMLLQSPGLFLGCTSRTLCYTLLHFVGVVASNGTTLQ